jgi:hypothetical protein
MIEKIGGGDRMRLLFVIKQRGIYASSGLRNFVRFVVDMLTEIGVEVKAVDVIRVQQRFSLLRPVLQFPP